jgi:hypothetical protein
MDLIDRGRAQSPESSRCEPNRMNPMALNVSLSRRDLIYSTVYCTVRKYFEYIVRSTPTIIAPVPELFYESTLILEPVSGVSGG